MKKVIFSILVMLSAFTASATIYYSQGSLDATLPTSWNTVREGGGSSGSFGAGSNTFIILTGHLMTTGGTWSIGGTNNSTNLNTLEIQSGGTLTATYLISVGYFVLDAGSNYIHNVITGGLNHTTNDIPGFHVTGAVLDGRTFNKTSTIEIQNWSRPGSIELYNSTEALPKVPYGNLTINIPTLSANWKCGMNPFIVNGNLDIKATGGGSYSFKAGGNDSLMIGGDFIMEGGKFSLTDDPGSSPAIRYLMSVGGNFSQTGGSFTLADQAGPYLAASTFAGGSNHILTVTGNTSISGGFFCGSGFITTGGVYTDATKITNITTATGPYNTLFSNTPIVGWGVGGIGIPSIVTGNTIMNISGTTFTTSQRSLFSEINNATLFAGPIISGCVLVNGAYAISVPDATRFQVGMRIGGVNIPFGSKITAINTVPTPNTITINVQATAGSTSTIIPEYVTITGTTAGYNNANYNLNLNGDLTIGPDATYAWTNADKDTSTSSVVLGGSFIIDPAATYINPPAWLVPTSNNLSGGASVYFKNGRSNVDLNIATGKANSNIAWVIASNKTVKLLNNLTLDKFFSVAGILDQSSNNLIYASPATSASLIDLTTSSVSIFHGKLYLNNESRIYTIPKSPAAPLSPPNLLLGMEVISSNPLLLAPNTIITQILLVSGTTYMIGISPASTSGAVQTQVADATTFSAGTSAMLLPLNLLSFKATLVNTGVLLNWATANEVGVKEFIIEKSTNGVEFSAIGTTNAKYVSSSNTYTFTDVDGFAYKTNFYRLRMMDLDGNYTYSNIETITVPVVNAKISINAFPNPTHGIVNISHPDAVDGAYISIVSLSGTVLSTVNVTEHALQTNYNASALPAGSYFILFYNNGKMLKSQFIKM